MCYQPPETGICVTFSHLRWGGASSVRRKSQRRAEVVGLPPLVLRWVRALGENPRFLRWSVPSKLFSHYYSFAGSSLVSRGGGSGDEDIATLDTRMPRPSPRYKSSPTQLPRSVRIQATPLQCFGDISLIWHRNEVYKDALEQGRRCHHFGSGPCSRSFVDHAVWPRQAVASRFWANLDVYRVGR
jgi:hypothetical protein